MHHTTKARRLIGAGLLLAAVCYAAATAAPVAGPDAPSLGAEKQGTTPSAASGSGNSDRLREGTKLANEPGVFQKKGGDRYTFRMNAGKREFACLENLSLERVAAAVSDTPDADWLVSGIIMEYRGTNYILISQAVLRAKSGRPAGRE